MLDEKGIRQLSYIVKIDKIEPIVGSDNCEAAVVGGWKVMVRKGTFQPGNLAIYFEIDSHVDTTKPEFAFLEKKHGNIKTQKYTFGGKNPGFYSQGLLMSAEDFGWFVAYTDEYDYIYDKEGHEYRYGAESGFLTKKLGVTYAVAEDNKRKAKVNPDAKINAALARHPKISKKYGKIIKRNKLLRAGFILLFGKKKDVRNWPSEVKKTDEERIENRLWTLADKEKIWVATEKIDGTSTTFHLRRAKEFKKEEYFVCSRNVVFNTSNQPCYYDTNVYLEMSEKYHMREVLQKLLKDRPSAEWVTVQAETYGAGIQKRDYGMTDHEMRAFNLIYSDCGRVGTIEMVTLLANEGIPTVPVLATNYILPDTIEQLREAVHKDKSKIDDGMREGVVFRTLDGKDSFKCVDPEYLIRFHS